jgi:hypothetical protein
MGTEKVNRGLHVDGGIREKPQLLTGKSTATSLTKTGPTFITVASATESATAAQYRFRLPTPVSGARKVIAVDNATTRNIQVVSATSGATFYGATYNAIQWTTGSSGGHVVELIGMNSTTWAVMTSPNFTGTTALPPRLLGVAT